MIKHVWSVLCKESLINQKNNNVSLLEVIEQIEIGFSIPTQLKDQAVNIPFEFTLVSLFFREGDSKSEEKIRLKLNFIDPKNKSLKTFEPNFDFPKDKRRLRSVVNIRGLELTHSGTYIFRVEREIGKDKYDLLAELPIEIIIDRKLVDISPSPSPSPEPPKSKLN